MFVIQDRDKYIGYDGDGAVVTTKTLLSAARFQTTAEAMEFLNHNDMFSHTRVRRVGWHGHEAVFSGVTYQIFQRQGSWRVRILREYHRGLPSYKTLKAQLATHQEAIHKAVEFISKYYLQTA